MPAASPGGIREALQAALVDQGDRLYALALKTTRDPDLAADALQEAFATALRQADQFRGEASLGTWLHRIVFNKSIDLLRRQKRDAARASPDPGAESWDEVREGHAPAWAHPPDELLLGAETRDALERALAELTPLQRAVIELRQVEGRSTAETAEILEQSEGAVRVQLHRARLRLRALLAPHLHGERR